MKSTPPGNVSDTELQGAEESPLTSGVRRLREALRQTTSPLQRLRHGDQPGAAISGASTAMFSTIRNRLIVWYIGVLAAILLIVGIVLYVAMQQTLVGNVNNNLATTAQIASRVWQQNILDRGDLTPLCQDGGAGSIFQSDVESLGISYTLYVACFNSTANLYGPATSGSGTNCANSPSQNSQSVCQFLTNTSLAHVALSSSTGAATDRVTIYGLGTLQRYAQVVYGPDGSIVGIVETATPINGQLQALNTLGTLLLICGLLTLLGATAGGIFLAQRALEPAHLAFRRQQEFIADAAHELRTPLTLLRANAEVLLRGREHLNDDDALLLEDIVAESAHMAGLANNLLTLARLDAGQGSLKRDVVDMAEIAADLIQQARSFASEQQVTLSLVQPAGPALVLGDETLLREATLILIDNAIKYNKPGGSVTVTVETGPREVTVVVRDTGVGIQAEHLAHLGERFYRPDKARSREMGGAGLGLSIARSIATAHSGSLSLTSVPGEGTSAVVTLAAVQALDIDQA